MIKKLLFMVSKKDSFELFFNISLIISPLFLLTISGWMTRIVVVCALLAIFVLNKSRKSINYSLQNNQNVFFKKLLCITLALPMFAIFMGQLFGGNLTTSDYDSPVHILICIFVLLATEKTGNHTVHWMSQLFPIALVIALAYISVAPNMFWGPNRITTNALDPLMFGSLSLTLGLLSLVSIRFYKVHSRWLIFYKLTGFVIGIYLSIVSGSRTGWMALPVAGVIWLYIERHKFTRFTRTITMATITIILFSIYSTSTSVHDRFNAAIHDLSSYQWNPTTPNADTSVGARISFMRIALFLFEKKPLSGWGDGNFQNIINDPNLNFANTETKRVALVSGFHNDITANMVRSGIWGLIATTALFLIPAIFFARHLNSQYKNQRDVAFLAMTFISCQFISSMTMEILTLKYSASFYGLMIAILSGQILFYNRYNLDYSNRKYL